MNLGTWLLALAAPLVVRGLIALGFTTLVFTGVTELATSLVTMAQTNWSAMPLGVLQLATLSGIPQVMGMIFGAYAARTAMWAALGLKRYILK